MGHSTMGFNQSRRAGLLLLLEELEALHTRLKGKTCYDRLDKTTVTVTTFIFITITLFTITMISITAIIIISITIMIFTISRSRRQFWIIG